MWILDKYIEVLRKIQELSNATRIYETYSEWIGQVTFGLFLVTFVLLMGFLGLGMESVRVSDELDGKWLKGVFVAFLVSVGLFAVSLLVYNEVNDGYKTLTNESGGRVIQVVSNMNEHEYNELQQVMQLNYGSDTGDVTLNATAKYLNDKLVRKEIHHHYHDSYYHHYNN